MAQRPNRLPSTTSLRDRTLINDMARNKLSQNLQQTGQTSNNSGTTSSSSGAGNVSFVNSGNSSEAEKSKSEFDKHSGSKSSNHGVGGSGNHGNGHTNSSARKSPSPSTSSSPGLVVKSPNSRTSSPKLVVKEALPEEKEQKTDIHSWMQDGMTELSKSNSQQNRLSPPGTSFSRVGSSPAQLTTLSDSKESLPSSSKSNGSMDGKEEKEHRRKSSKDISKDFDNSRVPLPENDAQKSSASDENSSSRGQSSFHHSQSLPDCVKHEEQAILANSQGTSSGGATHNSNLLSASPGSDGNSKSPKDANKNKRKSAPWLSVLSSNYKTKCEEFKKTFKNIPVNERLVVDYVCALQKDILVQGRMYVTEEWLCFYANIFKWETLLTIKLKEITSITKERTIRFIPNAIQITTESEKYFFTSFMSRDKTFLLLFRVWQNALIGQKMAAEEYWARVHANYGSNLGLSGDEIPEDYVKPTGEISIENGDDSLDEEYKDNVDVVGEDIFLQDPEQDLSYSEGSVSMSMSSATGPDSPSVSLGNNVPLIRSVSQDMILQDEIGEVQTLCQEEFDGREYFNIVYDIPVDKMAEALFSDTHPFMKNFVTERGHTDLVITPWDKKDENCDTRTFSYTYNLANAIGPKSCSIVETHTMRKDWCQQGHGYVNDLHVRQKGVPYCDYFYSCSRQTLTRVSSTSCRLRVQNSLIYVKNAWGFVKNFIEKNTDAATKETYKVMDEFIRQELVGNTYPVHPKKRRPRKRRATLPSKEDTEKRPEKRRSDSNLEGTEPFWLSRAANRVLPIWVNSRLEFLADTRNLMLLVCFVLILLSLFNMSLFLQLRALEDRSVHKHVWSPEEMASRLSDLPKNQEEWSVLLQQQQYYHQLELSKWKDVVGLCIQLIKQMESTLSELHSGLHPLKSMADVEELKKAMKGQGSSGEL